MADSMAEAGQQNTPKKAPATSKAPDAPKKKKRRPCSGCDDPRGFQPNQIAHYGGCIRASWEEDTDDEMEDHLHLPLPTTLISHVEHCANCLYTHAFDFESDADKNGVSRFTCPNCGYCGYCGDSLEVCKKNSGGSYC